MLPSADRVTVTNMRLPLPVLIVSVLIVSTLGGADDADVDSAEDTKPSDVALADDPSYAESVRHVRLPNDDAEIQNEDERPLDARPPKRRRLRKRKRRPQHVLQQMVRPRRRRPMRLDEADDGWAEMAAEGQQRPSSRRRVGPVYREKDESIGEIRATPRYWPVEQTTSLKDIRDILKQNGGLSLSEILLQKNLTLDDLLRGDQNAISALSERPISPSIPTATEVAAPPDLVPDEQQDETKRKDEQRKRFSQLYSSTNKIYGDVTTKYEVVTEATTEKRIFVPSHPKYYTSVNFKPEFELATDAPPAKKTTSQLPMTSAQMNMKIRRPVAEAKSGQKPAGVAGTTSLPHGAGDDASDEGPLKMSLDIDLPEQNVVIPDERSAERSTSTEPPATATEAPLQPEDVSLEKDAPVSEKLTTTRRFFKQTYATTKPPTPAPLPKKVTVSAKDEIMEIMRNSDVKEELEELLTSRNMTVEELVEQRERGSSQRHLAEIFHNKTTEPEPGPTRVEDEAQPSQALVATNRRPKLITTTAASSTTAANPKPLEDVNMSGEEAVASDKLSSTSFPTYKIETNKVSKEIPPLHVPIWKTIYPSIYIEAERNDTKLQLDAIEQSIQRAVDDGLNELSKVNNNLNEYDDYIQLPMGVKSAIFASLAIVGMSLVLFLTILVVFKWSQKHKKRLRYGGNTGSGFSCSKIKSPILQHEPKRTIRTFVSETLGKRRNFYAQHFRQSMSDSWETNERPYQ